MKRNLWGYSRRPDGLFEKTVIIDHSEKHLRVETIVRSASGRLLWIDRKRPKVSVPKTL